MVKVVNLKLQVIEEEIENALEHYSQHPYKTVFAIPEWRQKLLSYLLGKVPGSYLVIEDHQKLLIKHQFSYHSLELRLQLENHIHKGIAQLIQENNNKVARSIYQEEKPKNEPYQELA